MLAVRPDGKLVPGPRADQHSTTHSEVLLALPIKHHFEILNIRQMNQQENSRLRSVDQLRTLLDATCNSEEEGVDILYAATDFVMKDTFVRSLLLSVEVCALLMWHVARGSSKNTTARRMHNTSGASSSITCVVS